MKESKLVMDGLSLMGGRQKKTNTSFAASSWHFWIFYHHLVLMCIESKVSDFWGLLPELLGCAFFYDTTMSSVDGQFPESGSHIRSCPTKLHKNKKMFQPEAQIGVERRQTHHLRVRMNVRTIPYIPFHFRKKFCCCFSLCREGTQSIQEWILIPVRQLKTQKSTYVVRLGDWYTATSKKRS
jgi:hypothetical protein